MARYTALAVVVYFSLAVAGSAQTVPYPSPPPDFAHPETPHDVFYSVDGGRTDRPMLVIYARWEDVDFPPGFDAAGVASRYFGYPSVADYFFRASFGELVLSPAAETEGIANDGVVQIHLPGTKADFFTLSPEARNRAMVEAADPFVDFSIFDTNGDGSVSRLELALNILEANPLPPGSGSGIQSGIEGPLTLDGKNLALTVAMNGTHTALIIIIHENGHQILNMLDLYRFGVPNLDFAGSGAGEGAFYLPSAWQRMHWGWIAPTVVVRDGFYEVRQAHGTGDAFILYDPERGTDDYFIVEYRRQTPGTYDLTPNDSGLVIWRIDERHYGKPYNDPRPIELMRPDGTTIPVGCCYGGTQQDAWNPADPTTPQRTMTRTWQDGTDSRVAVRAIDRAGIRVRVYFDVRGPGVLVDPYSLDLDGPVPVTPGAANGIRVPVTNTGEACDTFLIDFINLPAGWTTTTSGRILCAGEESPALVHLTPAANAAEGVYTIAVRGRSFTDPSVTSMSSLFVRVVLRKTKFDVANVTAVTTGELAQFEIRAQDADDPLEPPVAGSLVTFTLSGPGGTMTASAATDGSGIAAASPRLVLPPGDYTLTIEIARNGQYAAALTTVPYTIEPRFLNSLDPAKVWLGLKNSDAVGLRVDLLVEAFIDSQLVGAGQLNDVATGSSGFNNAQLNTVPLTLSNGPVLAPLNAQLAFKVAVRRTCFGGGHNSGTPRLWYNGQPVDTGAKDAGSRFGATISVWPGDYFLRSGFTLDITAASSRQFLDVPVNNKSACPGRPFTSFGTWSMTLP